MKVHVHYSIFEGTEVRKYFRASTINFLLALVRVVVRISVDPSKVLPEVQRVYTTVHACTLYTHT